MSIPSPDFVTPLLAWYADHAADLPWREDQDAYRVWLSEIMLQQTQVATVIPYFHRFLDAFPTVHDLASASQDVVLKQWEGLGYYSRARNLHRTAQIVSRDLAGQFPVTVDGLLKLPGVGRYTAGAIASIAFDQRAPVLDGNVIRVFSRLFDIQDDVSQTATQKQLWSIAEDLVPQDTPGDYNQALMELGRTICKPKSPSCDGCPIAAHCAAYAAGVQEERPIKKKKAPIPHYDVTAGLVRNHEGHLLITKRPEDKMFGGMWEFPGGKQEPDEPLDACLRRELMEELGIRVQVGDYFVRVRQAFTHFKITLHVFECTLHEDSADPECIDCTDFVWVAENDLDQFAFSRADRKVIEEFKTRPQKLL